MKRTMLKILAVICTANLMFTVLPTASYDVYAAETKTVTLQSGYLNVRSEPSLQGSIVAKLDNGQQVSVASVTGDWSQVTVNGQTAYVMSQYLTGSAADAVTAMNTTGTVTSTTQLRVRTGPSTAHSVVGWVDGGSTVAITGQASTGWYRISYNGQEQYVSNDYISLQQAAPATPAPTQTGTDMTGKTGIVTGSVVNVRDAASLSGQKLTTVTVGTKLALEKKIGDWYQFSHQGKTSYIHADYVKVEEAPQQDSIGVTAYSATGTVVNTSHLNVRSGDSTNYSIVGGLSGSEQVTITGKATSGWYQISYQGQTAYVSNNYIQINEQQSVEMDKGQVNTALLNVRSGAGTSFSRIGTLSMGQQVEITASTGDWYQIIFNGGDAYVHKDYLDPVTANSTTPTPDSTTSGITTPTVPQDGEQIGIVTADALNFRMEPNANASKITVLNFGTQITILNTTADGAWYQVQVGGSIGYVSAIYISIMDPNATPNNGASLQAAKFIEAARGELGYKEGWDGTTKYGQWYSSSHSRVAWCAMFVSWCADQVGILNNIIPMHASSTAGMNWFINAGLWQSQESGYQPKVGDIVYFDWSGGNDPDHLGIVTMVANGKITTIEGNTTNSVAERTYSLTSSSIIGYGTPAYTE